MVRDRQIPEGATHVNLLNVDYIHLRLKDGADLYVTRHGQPFLEHLKPENWF